MLHLILTFIQVMSAVLIVLLVLLQRGKGAEAGAGFGAGASGTVFGARGATTALSRATAVLAFIFMANSLALAYLGTVGSKEPQKKTIFDEAAPAKPAQPPLSAPAAPPPAAPATAPAQNPLPAPK